MHLSLASVLAESALRHPGRPAVVLGAERVTYRDLWDQSLRYAAVMAERGVGPGDRVALLLPNVTDFPRAYYGVLALGGVVVPVHALLTAEEIAYVLRDSGARLLVCAAPLLAQGAAGARLASVDVLTVLEPADSGLPRLDRLARDVTPLDDMRPREPLDPAVILYTSGTTGKPKGAVLTHLNMVMNATVSAFDSIPLNDDDVVLGCLPLFHSFGQTCSMNATFRRGGTLVLMPRFDGPAAIDLMVREGVTVMQGVPTMYIALLEAAPSAPRLPRLRLAVSGGAALPVAVLERFQQTFGAQVYEGYGLSETSPVATTNQPVFGTRAGTVGHPIWGVRVEIARADLDDRVELLPRGEVGEIVIRGHNVFAGYLNRPEETAAALVDGWCRTGDIGRKDADGFVTILDRKKDLIIRGGFNVYPREVEETLIRHPAVAQVAVVGLPDEKYGEEVCAVVVPERGADASAEDIVEWARERLGRHKYPRRVVFVDEFPLGPSGKVLKRELVRRLTQGMTRAES